MILEVHHTALASAVMATGHLVFAKVLTFGSDFERHIFFTSCSEVRGRGCGIGSLFAHFLPIIGTHLSAFRIRY